MCDGKAQGIFLSLGSNLGDRRENLQRAKAHLPPRVRVKRSSSMYETEPWGYTDQPAFLNQVIEVETALKPEALLQYLKQIEQKMGREETFKFGPRSIDLDILFYGSRVIREEDLEIPHPRLEERAFVLVPLVELAPGLKHPVHGRSVTELLAGVDRSGVHRLSTS